MVEGGFPNKNRAMNAYDAYGDAMRPYVAQVLEDAYGPDWIRLRLLNDKLREKEPRRYDDIRQALRSKKSPDEIVDSSDIPNLVDDNQEDFPDLRDEIRNLFKTRTLRNKIVHSRRPGDCSPEDAERISRLCIRTLERCGLSSAVGQIRGLSPGAPAVADAELRKQQARRDWDKKRLMDKSFEELAPWEQQRLVDIESEEEWEQQEAARQEQEWGERERRERKLREPERAKIAAFGDDIDGLRRWFNEDLSRAQRHKSTWAILRQKEQSRERERRNRDRERQDREEREREVREYEQAEMATLNDDIEGLRRWFDAVPGRPERHLPAHSALLDRERAEREQAKITELGDNIDGLRRWFDADMGRQQRQASAYIELERRERNWLNVARRRLASGRAKKGRGKPAAHQVSGFFARSLAVRVSVILAISFVLIYVVAVARFGWPLVAGLEFAAMIWAATLPGLALAGHASYRFRTAYAGAADEKTRRGLWNALLMEVLAILAVSVLLIYVLIGVWYGWWLEPGFVVELGAAAIPGLVLAGHTGYRFRTANDGAVTAKNGHSPAFLSKGLFYLLMGAGLLALGAVALILYIIFSDSKDKKG